MILGMEAESPVAVQTSSALIQFAGMAGHRRMADSIFMRDTGHSPPTPVPAERDARTGQQMQSKMDAASEGS